MPGFSTQEVEPLLPAPEEPIAALPEVSSATDPDAGQEFSQAFYRTRLISFAAMVVGCAASRILLLLTASISCNLRVYSGPDGLWL